MMYSTYSQLANTVFPKINHDSGRCDENSPQSTPQRVAKEVIERFNESSAGIRKLREQIERDK